MGPLGAFVLSGKPCQTGEVMPVRVRPPQNTVPGTASKAAKAAPCPTPQVADKPPRHADFFEPSKSSYSLQNLLDDPQKVAPWLREFLKQKGLSAQDAQLFTDLLKNLGINSGISAVGMPHLDTVYDLFNVVRAYSSGDYRSIVSNVAGALIPGVTGKFLESFAQRYLPEAPEIERRKFKFVFEYPHVMPDVVKAYGPRWWENEKFLKAYPQF